MPKLVTSLRNSPGFTMIELLVTLVLLGLIVAVVAPGMDAWLMAREAAAQRAMVAGKLMLLPLEANRSGQTIRINSATDLGLNDVALKFEPAIEVNSNGYCRGGAFTLTQGQRAYHFEVLPPFCEVKQRDVNS
ncbi:prepilin-type N-terminal cleavage/methylation domain-containing protein [Bowmanella sp. Y26]|uniref:prepilin-type N-terminal cleavage/methylation domain-containing protein n=1 Tax=Bowmanella yangjiangensis TaxID=2811230 RepID=UPI001BDC6332|nr:prepilin-type N-terminal cleavage/methylation domain-containing protein [Bowmanella yangjiangensis]MBT1064899.1 prepilin-type N-terminal cleavage/methylation domain-containing protein [Bowmanella yangjiangensis]